MKITPTLNFGGQCREAIHLYEKAFGGKISCLITYREANDPAYMPLLREDQKDYIYHSELMLGEQKIIMSDHVDIEFTVAIPISSPSCTTQKKRFSGHTKS